MDAVAYFENTRANCSYSSGRVVLGLDFSTAAASSVAVVSLVMMGEWLGINWLPHQRRQKIAQLSRACSIN